MSILVLVFGSTRGGQVLFLSLCSGITPGVFRGIFGMMGSEPLLASALPTGLSLQPSFA